MKIAAWSLLLLVMRVQAEGQTPTTPSESFLLRTSEWHMTLKPTAGPNNVGNCMIVYPNGRLHLELRRQEFFLMALPALSPMKGLFRTSNSQICSPFSIRTPLRPSNWLLGRPGTSIRMIFNGSQQKSNGPQKPKGLALTA